MISDHDAINSFEKIHQKFASGLSSVTEKKLAKHLALFKKISKTCRTGHSFCALLDMHKFIYRYVSDGQEELSGIANDVVCRNGPNILTQQLHPADGPLVVEKAYMKAHEIMQSFPVAQRLSYVHTLTYRFIKGDGEVIPLLEVLSPLELDESGNISLALLQVYKLAVSEEANPVTLTVQCLEEGLYRVMHVETFRPTDKSCSLSTREKQVIKLVANGKTSPQIAHVLSISPNTVNNHRSNIKRKLKIHSTAELSTYAVLNNLMD